jgi:uncharacterized membrane protein
MELIAVFAAAQARVLPPSDVGTNVQILLRWIHLLAGVTWIGLLYFFNLVGFQGLPKLEPPVRGIVVTTLTPPPPELARRMRHAHLASRAGFWLTLPMLFLMAAASHYPLFIS